MTARRHRVSDAASPPPDLVAPVTGLAPGSPERALRQVAGWILPGAPDVEPLARPEDAEDLVRLASAEGLLGPLLACVDVGALDLPDAAVAEATTAHQGQLLWCMRLERRLVEVDDWFAAAGGVGYRVLKGPTVAHLDEPDASLRVFADLDLLVSGPDMDRALAALAAHGARRRIPERRPGFDRRFVKGVGTTCDDGVEVDVHRTLTGGAHGFRIPLARLFAENDTFEVADRQFLALSKRHRALHACYHAVVGSSRPPLKTLRDIAGYLSDPDLAVDDLVAESQRWRGTAVLAEGVRAALAAFTFEAETWREWASTIVVDRRELALASGPDEESTAPLDLVAFRELGWCDRARFAWAVAVPSRASLDHAGTTHLARARAGARFAVAGMRRGRAG